jgi:hypothetical protein
MGGRILLWFSAFVFIGYGLVGIAAPGVPAGFAGLVMSNGDAYAEISSMYGGLQTGLGVFCLLATLRPAFYRGGLAVLVLGIGGVGLTRLLGGVMASDVLHLGRKCVRDHHGGDCGAGMAGGDKD